MYKRIAISFFFGFLIIPTITMWTNFAFAESDLEKLQSRIESRNTQLSDIEAEIAKYEASLREVGAEKNTLQNTINRLNIERKKVLADLSYTENKIAATDLEINKLDIEIKNTTQEITKNEEAIRAILRKFYKADNESLIEVFLRQDNLSQFWGEFEELEKVKNTMFAKIDTLNQSKETLESQKIENTTKKTNLLDLKDEYNDQQTILSSNKAEKAQLLSVTKSEEREYQKLLAEKKAAEQKIQNEILEYESQIQFILDPSTIPKTGTQVFNWLFPNPIITQKFGGTEFAKLNAALYGGRPYHPGLDIAAPQGTLILAPLGGTVRATGNTDLVPGCSSWGKWSLIDHANGLTTLYAHQSLVKVVPGQRVETGEVIGYVGNTGFSTGPHTHFTVYVQDAVKVRKYNEVKTVTSCGSASSPFAPTDAYLDPELYLPNL